MKTDKSTKVIIKVDSEVQQENVKNIRRGLKTLQPAATDKENLAGRPQLIFKDSKQAFQNEAKKQKSMLMHKETQTEKYITNIDDLTGEEASIDYWIRLAEKRQETLDESLRENITLKEKIEALEDENKVCKEMYEESKQLVKENQKLKEDICALQEENKICKEMLEESRNLVEVLQEMISEDQNEEGQEAEDSENQD